MSMNFARNLRLVLTVAEVHLIRVPDHLVGVLVPDALRILDLKMEKSIAFNFLENPNF